MPFPSLPHLLHSKLILCQEAYFAAETALKENEIESINDGLCFPAVNELRYAGNHLARALASHDLDQAEDDADKALCHARRAIYDAYDALIMYYFEQCRNFKEEYKNTYIAGTIPQYTEHLYEFQKLKAEIALENRDVKENYAHKKQNQLDTIRTIYQKWDYSRDELNKVAAEERSKARWTVVGILAGVIGAAAAVIALIVTITSYID